MHECFTAHDHIKKEIRGVFSSKKQEGKTKEEIKGNKQ